VARVARSWACLRINSIRSALTNTHRRPIFAPGTLPARALRSKQSGLMCSKAAASWSPTVSSGTSIYGPYFTSRSGLRTGSTSGLWRDSRSPNEGREILYNQ
jgi:hypothetical protein